MTDSVAISAILRTLSEERDRQLASCDEVLALQLEWLKQITEGVELELQSKTSPIASLALQPESASARAKATRVSVVESDERLHAASSELMHTDSDFVSENDSEARLQAPRLQTQSLLFLRQSHEAHHRLALLLS